MNFFHNLCPFLLSVRSGISVKRIRFSDDLFNKLSKIKNR
ncbi:hypothetical protein NEISICOT_02111 [Neisseria sicca ATCC 29256]|uniref:Uncharacterized protein n=4 Tax=Neisseriaceae TaxID=481 RepID=A0A0C1GLR2_9NEIS|nr:hypothetical protein NEISICOT_02111 [Neisseria sicca ATCC 29256]EGQ77365.1 hypothetical protein HMPREF9418_1101 [Neisseria macacae ATCC 33926]EIG27535.1 hypothetical protein HMPREF1051_1136 [Neisseria sicca VK64]KIC06416.1 hypothetical protein MCC93_21530 [Morococcus cerebrosus]